MDSMFKGFGLASTPTRQPGAVAATAIWEFPIIRGSFFWGLYNKDPTIPSGY